ncbi:MAG TPA: phosphoribosylanthranilate isomerase, partial [Gemmatimonadaceae bacterium]
DDAAIAVLSAVPSGAGVARVGVFGDASPEQVAVRADRLGLDVVQLHADPDARVIADVRGLWSGQVWAVLRIGGGSAVPMAASDLFDVADAVVLDARVPGKLGGTGVALHWNELRERMETFRTRRARLVLAGGLRPENVASAVDELHPDVVDVSSGVEARVGVKDHGRMRAFRDAVHAMQIR